MTWLQIDWQLWIPDPEEDPKGGNACGTNHALSLCWQPRSGQ